MSSIAHGPVHACHLSSDRVERARAFAAFLLRGAAKEQQLYCVVDDTDDPAIKQHVTGTVAGVRLRRVEDIYAPHGLFDGRQLLATFEDALATAQAEGFRGVRVAADTGWLWHAAPDTLERFIAYEHLVTEVFDKACFAILCHYDATLLHPALRTVVTECHPLQLSPDDGVGMTAGACRLGPHSDGSLELSGEVDAFNAALLGLLIDEFAPVDGDVHLDVSGLEFIDVSGVRALAETAQQLGADRRLVLHRPPRTLVTIADVTGLARWLLWTTD